MPFLFSRTAAGWQALHVAGPSGHLSLAPMQFRSAARPDAAGAVPFLIRADLDGGTPRWVLFPNGAPVRHNGRAVAAGPRALVHRDALALAGHPPVYFSTEERATVSPFDGPRPVQCARCRDELAPGTPAVRCPVCGTAHHASAARDCWGYAPTCAQCAQSTAFDAEFGWTPEEI